VWVLYRYSRVYSCFGRVYVYSVSRDTIAVKVRVRLKSEKAKRVKKKDERDNGPLRGSVGLS
jgi:hypothetical protein